MKIIIYGFCCYTIGFVLGVSSIPHPYGFLIGFACGILIAFAAEFLEKR